MGELMRRWMQMASLVSELPPSYTKVDYIKAESYAFIDTGYVPVRYDEFEIEYMADSADLSGCLLSAGTGTYQLIALGFDYQGQGYYCKYFGSGSAVPFFAQVQAGAWQKMTISANGVFSVNGRSEATTYGGELDGANKTLYIFRRRNTSNPFKGKLKSFTIRNGDSVKMELVPCVRNSDGIAGMYDKVNKTFYGSASTSEQFKTE